MKKTLIIASIFLLSAQGYYILKLRNEIEIRKKVSAYELLKIVEGNTFSYTSNIIEQNYLEEPFSENENIDILTRIDILDMHLNENCKPSFKWIKNVCKKSKEEIIKLKDDKK